MAKDRALMAASVVTGLIVLNGSGRAAAPTNAPASTVISNAAGSRMLADGSGAYKEGVDCVRSWFNLSRGNYYFRTESNTFCDYPLPPGMVQRAVTFDFANPVPGHAPSSCSFDDGHGHTLTVCDPNPTAGTTATVPDVRLIADDLFKASALDTPVTIAFDLYPNFVNDTAFGLTFLQRVQSSGPTSARVLTAPDGTVAELSVRKTVGKKSTLVPVAQYYMPFTLTVTPCPAGSTTCSN